jgi:hypothetical protein
LTKDQLEGIVIDDSEAQLTGFETIGQSVSPFIGAGYAHDNNSRKGQQSAKFTPNLPTRGKYEVLVAYTAHGNRATNVPVTVRFAGGEKKTIINQQRKPPVRDLFFSLGIFEFAAGREGSVEISNLGTDGHVIIDAVQWLPQK